MSIFLNSANAMKKVILTGASGFVGKGLTTYLTVNGIDVIPVSRSKRDGFYTIDSYFDCPLEGLLIHLAEESNQSKVNLLGESYLKESIKLTSYLAGHYKKNMVYISSTVVYGDKNPFPNSEDNEVRVGDLYSKIKLRNEKIVLENGGLVLRIANLYGRGMSSNNVMSDILAQIDGDGPITVRNASPIRDFLSVDDLFSALLSILKVPCSGIINIGSGEGTSIFQLANIILSIFGQENRKIVSIQNDNVSSTNVLDIRKIKELTNWKPAAGLDQHLTRLIRTGEII